MATLNEVMKDTADAIHEKTGKSEKIAPVNFAEEIKSISAGGGGSEALFFLLNEQTMDGMQFAECVRYTHKGERLFAPLYLTIAIYGEEIVASIDAFCITPTALYSVDGEGIVPLKDIVPIASWQPITKEQFYDLNA